jgi:zinc protease
VLAGCAACRAEPLPESQCVLLPVTQDPTISLRIWFKVGSQDDPAGKEGLATLTAEMLAQGSTQQHRYEEILDRLFPLAANYSALVSTEMTVIHGRVHKDNRTEFYPLFIQSMLAPAFHQEDLDRLKSNALSFLENTLRYASDEDLAKALLYDTLFAGTPYGHPTLGLIQSMRSITLDDIRNSYRRHYTRDNVVLGVGGGFDKQLLLRLRTDLAALPSGCPAIVPPSRPKPLKGIHVTIVEKVAAATAISLGFPIAVHRGSKDWYALAVANSWLGEHRNAQSHLYQVIREQRGLNYGDYTYIERFPNGGQLTVPPQNVARRQQIFEMWLRPVPHETRHFVLRAALRELKQLVDHGMDEKEFLRARTFLKKFVPQYATTTMERLGYALDDRFYGIEGSHLDRFRRMMDEVTLADVNAAIRKYWQCDAMQIVIVTRDAQSLKEALVSNRPSPIKYRMAKPESVLQEDRLISTFPLAIPPQNVHIVPVAGLFEK